MLNLLGGVNERFTNTADDIANSAVLRDFARAHDMLALKELRLANGDCVAARTALVAGASGCTSPGGCRLSSSGAAHGGSGGRSGEQKKGGGGGGGYSGGGKRGGKCRGQQAGYPNQQQAGGAPWQVMGQQRPGGPMICFQWPTQFPGQGPYGAGSWRPGGQGLLGASPQAQTAFAPLQVSPAAQGWD